MTSTTTSAFKHNGTDVTDLINEIPISATAAVQNKKNNKPRTMNQSWSSLATPLSEPILKAVAEFGFTSMTPVQAACIPLFIGRKDVAAEAVTGSGKTLAFVIPILEILLQREEPLRKFDIGAVILTPTRELAIQIDEVISRFVVNLPQFTHCCIVGGSNLQANINKFRSDGAHIIVATIGRLEDLLKRKEPGLDLPASIKSLEVLVLDEADRLLSMGFKQNLNNIFSYLPKQRRTGLFSATQTREVEDLIRAGLRNPVRICVKETASLSTEVEKRTPALLNNYYMICNEDGKFSFLIDFIRRRKEEKILIFFSNCASVDYFSRLIKLLVKKVDVLTMHSKKDNRNKIFGQFRSMKTGILTCTDVMGRGVDIPAVHWVIQYDPPSSASNFVHRCGRTARIGNTGNALVLLMPTEDAYVDFICRNQMVPLEQFVAPKSVEDVLPRVRNFSLADRAIYEKGLQSFVSFIQSYYKHECQIIFRFNDLNLGKLATGFGLLHLPRMPELKGKQITDFITTEADYKAITFKDKALEKQRQKKIELAAANPELNAKQKFKPKTVSWSKQKEKKDKKLKRKEFKQNKRKRQQESDDDDDDDDFDDLAKDARLIKKLKSGKISKEQFDAEFDADS